MDSITIVVAADERGGIGVHGRLPWHLPADLKRFKALTMGRPIIMGRRTWDSIGRPLPGRHSIVVTRDRELAIDGATVVHSFEEARRAAGPGAAACVIGGADLFALALPIANVIELTRVHARVEADTFLPPIDPSAWRETHRERHAADDRHAYPFSFVTLVRADAVRAHRARRERRRHASQP
jgi:dihydrofolate reductase